jgi:hypothetical protein
MHYQSLALVLSVVIVSVKEMSREIKKLIEARASWGANFAGILIGFSITITALLVAQANEKMANLPQYGYTLAAFIYSTLAFLSVYDWSERATEIEPLVEKQRSFFNASCFSCTGYWSVMLGLVYLTSLIQLRTLNYPFFISFGFLVYRFIVDFYDFMWVILKGKKLGGIILLVLLFSFIIISVLTIPKEPFLALL